MTSCCLEATFLFLEEWRKFLATKIFYLATKNLPWVAILRHFEEANCGPWLRNTPDIVLQNVCFHFCYLSLLFSNEYIEVDNLSQLALV